MKKCFNCEIYKEYTEFNKNKLKQDGHDTYCRECTKIRNANYIKTERGLMLKIIKKQKASSRKRNHPQPTYTRDEIIKWMYDNGFKALYDVWVTNDYITDLIPSIDRLDDNLPYTLCNIRMVTWKENLMHRGATTRKTNGKKVHKLNKKTRKFICSYESVTEAAEDVGAHVSNILTCVSNNKRSTKGYRWEYPTYK